jgi:hypothetical protein
MPSFIDKLSTNDNDYRIEPYRLIDNQPVSHYQPQALTVIDSHNQIEYIYNVRGGEVDVEWRCQ